MKSETVKSCWLKIKHLKIARISIETRNIVIFCFPPQPNQSQAAIKENLLNSNIEKQTLLIVKTGEHTIELIRSNQDKLYDNLIDYASNFLLRTKEIL